MDCLNDWEGTRRFSLPETILIYVPRTLKLRLLLPVENGGSADIYDRFYERSRCRFARGPSGDNIPVVTLLWF